MRPGFQNLRPRLSEKFETPRCKITPKQDFDGDLEIRPQFSETMCFEDYTISILYPYIWSKENKLFIYKIIKPPGKEIFRPQIWPIVHVMHIIIIKWMLLYCILDSKAMKKQNSWIHTKENWGGILCCLMIWTKGSSKANVARR